jgi:DNA-binding response OmpR family regulator
MTQRILVIDDNAEVRLTVKHLLAAQGFEMRTATNGAEGILAAQTFKPDLVITDIIMPEMGGMETIQRIKAAHPGVRIIAMSGGGRLGREDLLEMARHLGADFALVKPFNPGELSATVARSFAA